MRTLRTSGIAAPPDAAGHLGLKTRPGELLQADHANAPASAPYLHRTHRPSDRASASGLAGATVFLFALTLLFIGLAFPYLP
ncbi:MAG: hypothetical protein KJO07_15685 [Deltaproteobacteria bacterium]|jgi:hypothetical protein|nr:hypothetical protein [Deltaproteobacteria bacterium]